MNNLLNFMKNNGRTIIDAGPRILQPLERMMGEAQLRTTWKRVLMVMSCVIVFVTTYMLILPAITLDRSKAASQPGIVLMAPGTEEYTGPQEGDGWEETDDGDGWTEIAEGEPAYYEEDGAPAEEYVQEADAQDTDVPEGEASGGEEPGGEMQEEPIEEPAYLTGLLTVNGEDYTVTADVPEAARIPEGAVLTVDMVSPEEYKIYRAQAEQVVDAPGMTFARFFDIRFEIEKDGVIVEVEPQSDIRVTIDPGQEALPEESVAVLHFGGEDATFALKALLAEKLTEDELKELLADGLTRDELRAFVEQNLTAEETAKLLAESITMEDLVKFVDEYIVEIPEGAAEKPTVAGMPLEEIEQIITDKLNEGRGAMPQGGQAAHESIYDLFMLVITGGLPDKESENAEPVRWEDAAEQIVHLQIENGSGEYAVGDAKEEGHKEGQVADTELVSGTETVAGTDSVRDGIEGEAAAQSTDADAAKDESVAHDSVVPDMSEVISEGETEVEGTVEGTETVPDATVLDNAASREMYGTEAGTETGSDVSVVQTTDGAGAEPETEIEADTTEMAVGAGENGGGADVADATTDVATVGADVATADAESVDANATRKTTGEASGDETGEGADSGFITKEKVTESIVGMLLQGDSAPSNAVDGSDVTGENAADGEPIFGEAVYEDMVLLEPPYIMVADTGPTQVAFDADSFSIYGVVYTVDFAYGELSYHMPGGSALMLSKLLQILEADINIADVTDVWFTNPELVEVYYLEDLHDWSLISVKPFDTEETLYLVLSNGITCPVTVTDEYPAGSTVINDRLTVVEIIDNGEVIGGTDSPDTVLVRKAHDYTMRFTFTEDDSLVGDEGQFPNEGILIYKLPNEIDMGKGKVVEEPVYFSIALGKRYSLDNNKATYYPKNGSDSAYIAIEWNTSDKINYSYLIASPQATFTLNYNGQFRECDQPIQFAEGVTLTVEEDPDYKVEPDKRFVSLDNDQVSYEVTARADGNAQNVTLADEMGEALKYNAGSLHVNYYVTQIDNEGNEEIVLVNDSYPEGNMEVVSETDSGFEVLLKKLSDGHTAKITYTATLDFDKVGGKEHIAETTKNTLKATSALWETSPKSINLEDKIDYLSISKRAGTRVVSEDGKTALVPWMIAYNPECLVDVEGATLKDRIDSGSREAVTYDTTKPFRVDVYGKGAVSLSEGGTINIAEGSQPIHTFTQQWDKVGSNDVHVVDFSLNPDDYRHDILSRWEWKIPEKSEHLKEVIVPGEDDPEGSGTTTYVPILNEDEHYTYVITYYTIEDTAKTTKGFVGNTVHEDFADKTSSHHYRMGVGPGSDISVIKEVLEDGGEYAKWRITFQRHGDLERALVEDTLPVTTIGEGDDEVTYKDVFYDKLKSADSRLSTTVDPEHGYEVTGLNPNEICVPKISLDGDYVVFWFYKEFHSEDSEDNVGGLSGSGPAGSNDTITITYYTVNHEGWMEASALGEAPIEHVNTARLVMDGWDADYTVHAIPKNPKIKKTVEEIGTRMGESGIPLPVYKYTLSLIGLDDAGFDASNKLVINDTYASPLQYIPAGDLAGMGISYNEGAVHNANDDYHLVGTVPEIGDASEGHTGKVSVTISKTEGANALRFEVVGTEENRNRLQYVKETDGQSEEETPAGEEPQNQGAQQNAVTYEYGLVYELTYYMTVDEDAYRRLGQSKVDSGIDSETGAEIVDATKYEFTNTAQWSSHTANPEQAQNKLPVDFKPVSKSMSYNKDKELCYYTIEVNPLRLKMNNGERYKVVDEYTGLSVDFSTMDFDTVPADAKNDIEWSHHGNKGVFWIPDETKVTITYEAWPIGKPGQRVPVSNKVGIQGYSVLKADEVTLKAEHGGAAVSYEVRLFKFADDNMDVPLGGAVFQLYNTDDYGHIVPMKYGKASSKGGEADSTDWRAVNKAQTEAGESQYPTQENHAVGDNIYFVTNSATGLASILLSQARDGVALKKGVKYYLKEVRTPPGYLKEDHDWDFIIGDRDDYDNHIYASESLMQVSNTSLNRSLKISKTFNDRTGRLTYDEMAGVTFEIRGTLDQPDASGHTTYFKSVTYDEFMRVFVPKADNPAETEEQWLFIIRNLPIGRYTVTEVHPSSDQMPDYSEVAVSVEATQKITPVTGNGEQEELDEAQAVTSALDAHAGNGGTYVQFEVEDKKASAVEVDFTNTYTEQEHTSVTVSKEWAFTNQSGKAGVEAEFALYADGVKYPITVSEGGNENGNIVLPKKNANNEDVWSFDVDRLPLRNKDNGVITWSVAEIGAAYSDGDPNHPIEVSGRNLTEHFTVTAETGSGPNRQPATSVQVYENADDAASGTVQPGTAQSVSDGDICFTNTPNSLVHVAVEKVWKDAQGQEVAQSQDEAYFDLYRTTSQPADYTRSTLEGLVNSREADLVLENVKLVGNGSFADDLMEKDSSSPNAEYYYFVLERSVAGYGDSYAAVIDSQDGSQALTITNTLQEVPASDRGKLKISKAVNGINTPDLDKEYKFTLWNSGKYLQADGSLSASLHEFAVKTGVPVEVQNVLPGTYVLAEIEEDAQINDHELTGVTIQVGSDDPINGNTANVAVSTGSDIEIAVTNTYNRLNEKTDFTFGKLWVTPDQKDDLTRVWPEGVTVTMQIRRRDKNGTPDSSFGPYEYDIYKDTGAEGSPIVSVPKNNAPDLTVMPVDEYSHYTFKLEELDKYQENGNEWEYYAVETGCSVSNNGEGEIRDGVTFGQSYGRVDGIVALPVAGWNEASSNREIATNADYPRIDYVESAINRLNLTTSVKIPITKILTGWEGSDPEKPSRVPEYTKFGFKLYYKDSKGRMQTFNVDGKEVFVCDSDGKLVFDVTGILDLNNTMKWKIAEDVLKGEYTFKIAEVDPKIPGVSCLESSINVDLTLTYNWATAQMEKRMTVKMPGQEQAQVNPGSIEVVDTYDSDDVSLRVMKHWDDDNNRDGYRTPVSFKVKAEYLKDEHTLDTEEDDEWVAVPDNTVWFVEDGRIVKDKDDPQDDGLIDLDEVVYNIEGTDDMAAKIFKLPKYYNSYKLRYKVEEQPVEGIIPDLYTKTNGEAVLDSNIYNYTLTNTHTPETIRVKISKLWDDNSDSDLVKRSRITVRLKATYTSGGSSDANSGETGGNGDDGGNTGNGGSGDVTVDYESIPDLGPDSESPWSQYKSKFADIILEAGSTTEDWTGSWDDLPRYAPGEVGKLVHYTVEELPETIPLGYHQVTEGVPEAQDTAAAGGTAENAIKNAYEYVNIPLEKVWNDDSNRDNVRPSEVTMNLEASWKDPSDPDAGAKTITIDSSFKDKGNQAVSQTRTITSSDAVVGDANDWKNNGWTGLPKYYHGQEIIYKVTESGLDENGTLGSENYVATGDGIAVAGNDQSEPARRSVTNTRQIDRVPVKLTKTWDDKGNQDGKRPDVKSYVATFVHLYATLTPESNDTTELVIKSTDNPVSGTTNEYYLYKKTAGTVDSNPFEAQTMKPTVRLEVDNSTDTYTITYRNLPKNKEGGQGEPISYTMTETDDEGNELSTSGSKNLGSSAGYKDYQIESDMSKVTGTDRENEWAVANKYVPETISIKADKLWNHGSNLAGDTSEEQKILRNQVKLKLVAKDGNTVITDAAINQWPSEYKKPSEVTLGDNYDNTVTWSNLPKYVPGQVGHIVTYTVEETKIPDGYHTDAPKSIIANSVANNETGTVSITNTYQEVEVKATKDWNDANNQDDSRKNVTFRLYRKIGNGNYAAMDDASDHSSQSLPDIADPNRATQTIPATATGNVLTVSWKHLPKWIGNQSVLYDVREVKIGTTDVAGNVAEGYTVTDSTPQETAVTPTPTPEPGAGDGNQGDSATAPDNYLETETISNSRDTEKTSLTFTKVWDNKGDVSKMKDVNAYKAYLLLYYREKNTNTSPAEIGENSNVAPNWRGTGNANINVVKYGDTYQVTINNLPKFMPKQAGHENDPKKELEYFVSEKPIDHYTVSYPNRVAPTGSETSVLDSRVGQGETLTNTHHTGDLTISKTLISDLMADEYRRFTFTIATDPVITGTYSVTYSPNEQVDGGLSPEVEFGQDGKATVTIRKNQNIVINDIPTGVEYTVTETAATNFETPKHRASDNAGFVDGYSHVSTLSGKGDNIFASFQNTRIKGNLKVSKDVVSVVEGDANHEYTFKIKLKENHDKQYSTLTQNSSGGTDSGTVTFVAGEAYVKVKEGKSVTIVGLPTDLEYSVTEVSGAVNDDQSQHTAENTYLGKFTTSWRKGSHVGTASREFNDSSHQFNVITEDASEVEFINTRKTGTLKVAKIVESPFGTEKGTAAEGNYEYKFKITFTRSDPGEENSKVYATLKEPGKTAVVTLQFTNGSCEYNVKMVGGANHAIMIEDLPMGTEYSVEEIELDSTLFENSVVYKGIVGTTNGSSESVHQIDYNKASLVEATNSRKWQPVSLFKVSAKGISQRLDGAEFDFAMINGEGYNEWYVKKLRSVNGCLVELDGNGDPVSPEVSKFNLYPGQYTLTETYAPDGYYLLEEPATFTVSANGITYVDGILGTNPGLIVVHDIVEEGDEKLIEVNIANSPGVELPSTGGIGTRWATLMGLILAVFSGGTLLLRKRRAA